MTIAAPTTDFAVLAARVRGELRWDEITRALYASSASIVEIWPQAVLTPHDAHDVREALAFCAEQHIPITCRGAGSGVVGQSLGEGLIIDFSVHMNRILEINAAQGWVRVEPGVVKDDLDTELAAQGLFWPPDPSSSPWCTVGAMIANNSGGAKSVRYGTARDYLLELDLLDWRGESFKLRPIEIAPEGRLIFTPDAGEIERRLAAHVYRLIRRNRETLRAHRPQATRCSSGYNLFQLLPLEGLLPGEPGFDERVPRPAQLPLPGRDGAGANRTGSPWILDMPRLFCGSEGSLAVLTSAKIRVVPLPKAVAGASFSFDSDQKMAEGVVKLLAETKPAKLELLDRTFIDVAARAEPELAAELPARLKTMLVAEYFGESPADVAAQADHAVAILSSGAGFQPASSLETKEEQRAGFPHHHIGTDAPLAFEAHAAYDPAELDRLWRIRKIASPILSRVKGDQKPTRWVEDIAVPPWKLPLFIQGVKAAFARNGFEGALFGHAGEGNLHVNPKANVKDAEVRARMRTCADEVFALAKSLGGVISGEHGDGVMRSPYLRRMFGEAYDLMVEIKREWDPHWLLNPLTKVLRPEDEARRDVLTDLRLGENYTRHKTGTGLDRPEILEEIEKCHGCGKCRTYCPLMGVGKEEKYTARAKANLLRAVVAGKLDAGWLVDPEFKENIDLCINCGQCLVDCPTHVDIPGISIVFREQYLESKGTNAVGRLLSRPDRLGRVARAVPGLANTLLSNRFMRGAARKAMGLDERRHLPEYRKEHGLPARQRLNVPVGAIVPKEIVLFPGCWAEYNDPDGEKNAALRVFQALGCTVHMPRLNCCGISKITQGDTASAARDMAENVERLLPFVQRGAKIVFSAPSCLLASRHDLPRLVKTGAARRVADASIDAHQLLRTIFEHPGLRSQLQPLGEARRTLAYHQPCHSKVSNVGLEPFKLVKLIPGSEVVNLNAGCCGLSGTFGMKTDNFDLSMRVGSKLFDRIEAVNPDAVFTPCGICQTQIMQGEISRGDEADDGAIGGRREQAGSGTARCAASGDQANGDALGGTTGRKREILHPLKLLYDALP